MGRKKKTHHAAAEDSRQHGTISMLPVWMSVWQIVAAVNVHFSAISRFRSQFGVWRHSKGWEHLSATPVWLLINWVWTTGESVQTVLRWLTEAGWFARLHGDLYLTAALWRNRRQWAAAHTVVNGCWDEISRLQNVLVLVEFWSHGVCQQMNIWMRSLDLLISPLFGTFGSMIMIMIMIMCCSVFFLVTRHVPLHHVKWRSKHTSYINVLLYWKKTPVNSARLLWRNGAKFDKHQSMMSLSLCDRHALDYKPCMVVTLNKKKLSVIKAGKIRKCIN